MLEFDQQTLLRLLICGSVYVWIFFFLIFINFRFYVLFNFILKFHINEIMQDMFSSTRVMLWVWLYLGASFSSGSFMLVRKHGFLAATLTQSHEITKTIKMFYIHLHHFSIHICVDHAAIGGCRCYWKKMKIRRAIRVDENNIDNIILKLFLALAEYVETCED